MNPTEFIDALNDGADLFSPATNTHIRQKDDIVYVDTPEVSTSTPVNIWAISPSGEKVDLYFAYRRVMTIAPGSYKVI